VSSSETQIDVAWTPPDDDPDAEPAAGASGSPAVGHGRITGYEVDVSDDGKTWSLLATVAGKLDEEYTYDEKTKKVTVNKVVEDTDVEFFHKGLVQGQTKYYRVSTINNAPSSSKRSVTSDVMNDMTLLSLVSDSPGGLVVKAIGYDTIELLWNARADDITAANIIGYKIESSPLNAAGDDCAENWSTLVEDTMSTTTSYTHTGLMPETGYCYRVFGINVVATSSGYVGYGEGGVLTEGIRRTPFCVVLLDEIEKAHKDVIEMLYQVLDRGWMEDAEGIEADFSNALIILTSNAGDKVVEKAAMSDPPPYEDEFHQSLTQALAQHFPAAFIGRLQLVPYWPLGEDTLARIAGMRLDRLSATYLASHRARLAFNDDVRGWLAERVKTTPQGARFLDGVIAGTIRPKIAEYVLGRLNAGEPPGEAVVLRDEDGEFSVRRTPA